MFTCFITSENSETLIGWIMLVHSGTCTPCAYCDEIQRKAVCVCVEGFTVGKNLHEESDCSAQLIFKQYTGV